MSEFVEYVSPGCRCEEAGRNEEVWSLLKSELEGLKEVGYRELVVNVAEQTS